MTTMAATQITRTTPSATIITTITKIFRTMIKQIKKNKCAYNKKQQT